MIVDNREKLSVASYNPQLHILNYNWHAKFMNYISYRSRDLNINVFLSVPFHTSSSGEGQSQQRALGHVHESA